MYRFIDTHTHLDGKEFDEDRDLVVQRAKGSGAIALFVPATDLSTSLASLRLSELYPGFIFPMAGLHPEEVNEGYLSQLEGIRDLIYSDFRQNIKRFIGIGEVGLDFYWSREHEKEQMSAFERQVEWSVETRLPLMIHCRKAQNEMVSIMKPYAKELPGGVFHCFTGNMTEAEQLLEFEGFCLGIGGVLTFKKSRLPEVIKSVPINRIVLETDSPYMSPEPLRGKRNESSHIPYIIYKLAEAFGTTPDHIAEQTTQNAIKLFLE